MSSQKIPIANGMMTPLPNDVNDVFVKIFSPPDKALTPQGIQAFYEVHAWLLPPVGAAGSVYKIVSLEDGGDPLADGKLVWQGTIAGQDVATNTRPIKVLDGYPVRGNVSLYANVNTIGATDPAGQIWGHYYRVGQGPVIETSRRFFGAAADLSLGVPVEVPATSSIVLHTFQKGRIDDLAIALVQGSADSVASLLFEDVNNVIMPGTNEVDINVTEHLDSDFTPPGPYILQGAFGGGAAPTLDHLRVKNDTATPFTVHGYFRRA